MTITVSIFNEISHGCDPVLETESYHDATFVVNQQCWHHDNSRVSAQESHTTDENPHDDVIKCKHLRRYWSFVRGIHRSPVNSPQKGQWRGALMFSLISACRVNNREAGDLRQHRAHYDVTVMQLWFRCCLGTHQVYKPLPDELQRLPAVFACASPSDALLIDCG